VAFCPCGLLSWSLIFFICLHAELQFLIQALRLYLAAAAGRPTAAAEAGQRHDISVHRRTNDDDASCCQGARRTFIRQIRDGFVRRRSQRCDAGRPTNIAAMKPIHSYSGRPGARSQGIHGIQSHVASSAYDWRGMSVGELSGGGICLGVNVPHPVEQWCLCLQHLPRYWNQNVQCAR